MSFIFHTDTFIEEPFFIEMANMLGGEKKERGFNGKVAYQNCRCPSCGKNAAVMGYMRSADTFMLACPVESHIFSLNGLTLHDLIKQYGGEVIFDGWRKARWIHVLEWLPINSLRQGKKKQPQQKTFME